MPEREGTVPDTRKHRGAHPQDRELFAARHHGALRLAVAELSWLLSHGYAGRSALKLVGDRHELVARQRMAVRRSACSDLSLERRRRHQVDLAGGARVGLDGYNVLITVESALSGGVVLGARDGCRRDLASTHGTYRKVHETQPAITLIAEHLSARGVKQLDWYLDRPVSNSGLLRQFITEVLTDWPGAVEVQLVDSPDRVLADYDGIVATSDSWILDRCERWTNLAAELIGDSVPDAWLVSLE